MKKILASIVGLSMVVMMAPGLAQGTTVEELQAQITALMAQITALNAQIAALTGAPAGVPTACTGITFTRNLSQGASGTDVQCLQALLNQDVATQLAATGVGSAGNETTYFGPLTKAAVVKYQVKYAADILTPLGLVSGTGFVGSSTRAKLSAALTAVPVTPPVDDVITTPGVEGSIMATIASTPTSGVEMTLSKTGVGVAAVNAKAVGSDILVNRFDLNFDTRPWLYITGITITDGTVSKSISVTQANTIEVTVGSSYTNRVDGLNILIPEGTTKTLTIKVDSASGLPGTETTKNIVLTIAANAIRGVDGASIQQYAPTAALATRTFTVKSADTAALEVTAHADNPKARPVLVSATTETTGVVLAKINVKATGNDAILRTVKVADSTASGTLNAVYLYDGDTLLSSTSTITTASSHLTDVDLTIPKDTTKVLTVKADVKKGEGNFHSVGGDTAASSTVTVQANTDGFSAEDATSYASVTITGSDVTPGVGYFYTKAPTLALVSTSIVGLTATTGSLSPQQAEAKIRINVTANGGDIYVAKHSATNASSGLVASVTATGSTTLAGDTISSNADDTGLTAMWVVRSGETKYFEYGAVLNTGGNTGYSDYLKFDQINWGTSAAGLYTAAATENAQTWGLTDFKTSPIFLQAEK